MLVYGNKSYEWKIYKYYGTELTKINPVVCTVGVSSLLCLVVRHVSLKTTTRRGCYLCGRFVLTDGKGTQTREQASWTAYKKGPHYKISTGDRSDSCLLPVSPLLLSIPCAEGNHKTRPSNHAPTKVHPVI